METPPKIAIPPTRSPPLPTKSPSPVVRVKRSHWCHRAGDECIVQVNEGGKALAREFFHVSNRTANGAASLILGLLVDPDYLISRQMRFFRGEEEEESRESETLEEEGGEETQSYFGEMCRRVMGTAAAFLCPRSERVRRSVPRWMRWEPPAGARSLTSSRRGGDEDDLGEFGGRVVRQIHGAQVSEASVALLTWMDYFSDFARSELDAAFMEDAGAVRACCRMGRRCTESSCRGLFRGMGLLLAQCSGAPRGGEPELSRVRRRRAGGGGMAEDVRRKRRRGAMKLVREVSGLPVLTYTAETADGYLLRLVRLPRKEAKGAVLFVHGLLDGPVAWVNNGRAFSLGCRAWHEGFDVYLGSLRGCREFWEEDRRVHRNLEVSDRAFFQYSVDDHGLDVLALADHIHAVKKSEGIAHGVKLVGVGHSMGGCALLMSVLHARALAHDHGFSGLCLLSPAGLHRVIGTVPWLGLRAVATVLPLLTEGPFPPTGAVPDALGGLLAMIGDELLSSAAALRDAITALTASVVGGRPERVAFGHKLAASDYPLGGTAVRVLRHGCQSLLAGEFQAYDFGPAENVRRYNQRHPPSYRREFGLFDIPIHFVAGGRDELIPPANLLQQAAVIRAVSPAPVQVREFPEAGHLDFTLSEHDGIVSYVLQTLQAIRDDHSPTAHIPPSLHSLPFALEQDLRQDLAKTIASASQRIHHSNQSQSEWKPARELAIQYPFLASFSKLDAAWAGLDSWRRGDIVHDVNAQVDDHIEEVSTPTPTTSESDEEETKTTKTE